MVIWWFLLFISAMGWGFVRCFIPPHFIYKMELLKMEAVDQVNKLPEVKAKIYAEAFGFSKNKVNDMCASKDIPCRKMGKQAKGENTDNGQYD